MTMTTEPKTIPSHPTELITHLIVNLWVASVIYPSGKCKIGLIAAHSWDNIPWEFPGRWNVLLARIDYIMHYHGFLSQLFLEETTKITFLVSRARLSGLRDYYFPVLFTAHWKYIVVIGWSSLLFKFTWGIGLYITTVWQSFCSIMFNTSLVPRLLCRECGMAHAQMRCFPETKSKVRPKKNTLCAVAVRCVERHFLMLCACAQVVSFPNQRPQSLVWERD